MAISLNTVNSEVIRAHKRIDDISLKDVSVVVNSKLSMLRIHNTIHVTVIFGKEDKRVDISANLLPKSKVLGQGIAPVRVNDLNIACPTKFELSPDGSFKSIGNVEGSTVNGSWGLAMFLYNI